MGFADADNHEIRLPQYEIDATVDTACHTIAAKQKVVFTNNTTKPTDVLYFHIYPHRRYTQKEIRFLYRYSGYFKVEPYPEGFQGGDLKINSVKSGDEDLSYLIENKDQTILKVRLAQPLLANQSIELEIDFSVEIPHAYGRFGWHNNIISLLRWYPILSLYDEKGWHNYPFYLYHQPYISRAADYKLKLTLPEKEVVAHSGSLKKEMVNPDGTKTLFIESELPIRDFALGVSPDFALYTLEFDGKRINSFHLHGDEERAKEAAEDAAGLMRFYGKKFGSYPYSEFNIVPSYLACGGHESSNLIFIDTRVYKLPRFLQRYFDFLISHETGHQWFYNMIGSDEYRETFMDEGLNSYWLQQYLEDKYGEDAQVLELPKGVSSLVPNFSFRRSGTSRYFYMVKRGLDHSIISPLSSFREPSAIFALAYGKGVGVLEMLNSVLGKDIFLRVMQRYTREFCFKNAYLDDFIRICEEEYEGDLNWFFDAWLKTDNVCDYAVEVKDAKIILERRGQIQVPVEIEVHLRNGKKISFDWQGKEELKEFPLPQGEKVKMVRLGPEDRLLLDIDQTNNIWPRRLNAKPVPLYFFIYEIPLFLPQDAYSLVFGPDLSGGTLGAKASWQKPDDHVIYTSAGYELGEDKLKSTLGYEMRHLFGEMNSLGFELFDDRAPDKENEFYGVKVYLRHELWPASYGLADLNDHITFYVLRDREFDYPQGLSGLEDVEHLHYRKRDEAIFGISGSFGRCGPYPDPDYGWRIMPTQEFAGHFLGGKETFWRSSIELNNYFLLIPEHQHKLALRTKIGWGEPDDKNLFYLGSDEGLRGYARKEIKGSHMLLASLEYRLPLLSNLQFYFLDNIIHLEKIQGVVFFDGGHAWYSDFSQPKFKKDAGVGFRLHLNIGSFVEKIIVRLDVAQVIDEPKRNPRFWLGLSHTF